MFSKLLKYDFKKVKKFGIPILFTLLGITVLGCINAVFLINVAEKAVTNNGFLASVSMISSVFLTVFIFFIIALSSAGIQVAILADFYKSLVSDVGYLTFTLPVKPKNILLSKLLNSTVWSLIVGICSLLSAIMIILFMTVFEAGESTLIPPDSVENFGVMGVLAVISAVLFFAAYFINSQLLYFMTIFFASVISRKNKILVTLGCIFGVNFIYGILSGITQTVAMFLTANIASTAGILVAIIIYCSIGAVFLAGLAVLYFFLTKYMMEKKINLP